MCSSMKDPTSSRFSEPFELNRGSLDVGSNSSPDVADWNGDGKKDLIIGNDDGEIYIFFNKGTNEDPQYENKGEKLPLKFGKDASPRVMGWNRPGPMIGGRRPNWGGDPLPQFRGSRFGQFSRTRRFYGPGSVEREAKAMRRFNLAAGVFCLIALGGLRMSHSGDGFGLRWIIRPRTWFFRRSLSPDPIFIGPFEDKRKTRDQIGENIEKSQSVPIKADPAEILTFFENAFHKEFRKVGLNIVESRNAAGRILHVSVLNLWVQEKNTYQSTLVVKLP